MYINPNEYSICKGCNTVKHRSCFKVNHSYCNLHTKQDKSINRVKVYFNKKGSAVKKEITQLLYEEMSIINIAKKLRLSDTYIRIALNYKIIETP